MNGIINFENELHIDTERLQMSIEFNEEPSTVEK